MFLGYCTMRQAKQKKQSTTSTPIIVATPSGMSEPVAALVDGEIEAGISTLSNPVVVGLGSVKSLGKH